MKTKLTLTIDEDVIHEAKQHAASQQTSLSQLVENALSEQTRSAKPRFGDKWRGRFKAAGRDDARYAHLMRRHA